ncbi:MAG: DUF1015 family protein [Eubacteriaceae bacterium]|jgi:uncharacterized protein (DUF1015 family)|nr:DUF1015 family protein [Eubacteriaceae bacterium]
MAVFIPFRAVRPNVELADKVAAPPYDVVDGEEARRIADADPYSFLHITRSEVDLPEDADPYAGAVYKKAKKNIEHYLSSSILFEETKPMYYIYRITADGISQTGIAGCVSIDEYNDGTIKKHEVTLLEKEVDRTTHFDVCGFDTEPVLLTYRHDARIDKMIGGFITGNHPEYSFTDANEVTHEVWVISDDNIISGLTGLFASVPDLYIADGHHRSASAASVGFKKREEHPGYDGSEDFNYFMAVLFPDDQLRILGYNRVIKGLDGNTEEEFLQKVRNMGFRVEEAEGAFVPQEKHIFGMCLEGKWYSLTAEERLAGDDIIGSLDVTILQKNILAPILGIFDPRADHRIDFVGGSEGPGRLQELTEGAYDVAFSLNPVLLEEIMTVADEGKIMPPKSTWFDPKPASGLFMHHIG